MAKRGNPNWQKGKSANPGGRTKTARAQWVEFKRLCREQVPESIAVLASIRDGAERDSDRVAASKLLIAYGWGSAGTAEIPAEEIINMDAKGSAERIELFKLAIAKEQAVIDAAPLVHEGNA